MRCAIYTRVSTDEQATSEYSLLRRQEEVCRIYIDIQTEKGWQVTGVYKVRATPEMISIVRSSRNCSRTCAPTSSMPSSPPRA
jgi:DNA invertase Pin-like site-specific DNA recombinase